MSHYNISQVSLHTEMDRLLAVCHHLHIILGKKGREEREGGGGGGGGGVIKCAGVYTEYTDKSHINRKMSQLTIKYMVA